jgi:hypothetical protein
VEGAEELVFRGAREILTTAHPAIIFEINPEGARALGLSPQGAWDILGRMGYGTFLALDGNALILLRASPESVRSVIALHSTKGI